MPPHAMAWPDLTWPNLCGNLATNIVADAKKLLEDKESYHC